jgi:hypothetical protein
MDTHTADKISAAGTLFRAMRQQVLFAILLQQLYDGSHVITATVIIITPFAITTKKLLHLPQTSLLSATQPSACRRTQIQLVMTKMHSPRQDIQRQQAFDQQVSSGWNGTE